MSIKHSGYGFVSSTYPLKTAFRLTDKYGKSGTITVYSDENKKS